MCLILIVYITFCYNVICVNYDVCGYLYVQYEYNITLYNLIIRKYRGFFYMCVYCYHIIIIFCYKVNKIQGKKFVKLVIVQAFDWLSRHVVYNFIYE